MGTICASSPVVCEQPCPPNSTGTPGACTCNANYSFNSAGDQCVANADVKQDNTQTNKPPQSCPAPPPQAGNPIYPLTGTKTQVQDTGLSLGGYPLLLTYNTAKHKAAVAAGVATKDYGDARSFGPLWMSSLHRTLTTSVGALGVNLHRGDGTVVSFKFVSGAYTPADAESTDKLVAFSEFSNTFPVIYRYTDSKTGALESYNGKGQILSIAHSNGAKLTYTYSDMVTPVVTAPAPGYLIQIKDNNNRLLDFEYALPSGGNPATDARIVKIRSGVSPFEGPNYGNYRLTAAYDATGNLSTLTWPDGKTRQFLYENASLPWALTGIVDENAVRHSTYGYDAVGNATSTELAGGVNKYTVTYASPPTASVTQLIRPETGFTERTHSWQAPVGALLMQPSGASAAMDSTVVLGVPRMTTLSQPAGSGCAASSSTLVFDAAANVTSKDDFTGQRTCYAYDAKNQETTRVEGLANTVDCASVLPANATLPANARKTTTQWHPTWRVPTKITAPGSITTRVYHNQPDPFGGPYADNHCTAGNLPDGSSPAHLCKQVVQATLPSGAIDTTVPNQISRYTYDGYRILTATDPQNRTTTYVYWSATSFTSPTYPVPSLTMAGRTVGDLQTITNPAGHITSFDSYDSLGRVLKTTDPKGIVTDMTYTPRGWVNTVTTTAPGQSPRTTSYTYDNVGQLTGVTNPDGSTLAYTYDAAHRLTGATDAKGNSVTYTLDNMGNRIKEDIKDPGGVLQRSINRSFDALNRLQQVSGVGQ